MKTTIKNINLSLKGFLTISDAYTLPTNSGGLGDIMMSDGIGGVSWQPVSALSITTDDVVEASNLYFTDERVDDRVSALIQNGTGLNWTYNDVANTFTGNVTLIPFTTDDLSEGSNLYFTNERVDDQVAILIQDNTGISWNYVDVSGTLTPTINLSDFTTDDLPEGTTNLYFTNEAIDDRVASLIQNGTGLNWTYNDPLNKLTGNVTLSPFTTDDLSEGSNLYFTEERVDDRVASLIQDSATVIWSYNDILNTLTANAVGTNLVEISKNGSTIASQPEINFIEGSDISLSIVNDGANNRVNVTVSNTATSGQPGTVTTIINDGIQIGDSDIVSIEFSDKFTVTEPLDTYIQVDIDMSIEELNNVSLLSPISEWDVLRYNSTFGTWENGSLDELLNIDQLLDVTITAPQDGEGLLYNSSLGIWENRSIPQNLLDLDDVSISSPAQSGDILMYNSSSGVWENIEGVISSLLDVSSITPTDLQALRYNALSGLWQPFNTLYKIEKDSATVTDSLTTLNFTGSLTAAVGLASDIIDVTLDPSLIMISELGDVSITSPILDGDSLIWNESLGIWENGTPNAAITMIQVDAVTQNVGTPTLDFSSNDFLLSEGPADVFDIIIKDSGINHDATSGYIASEHVDHSIVFIISGNGLGGGGDITASRTLSLDFTTLSPLSDLGILESVDTFAVYNNSAGAHENVTLTQLAEGVRTELNGLDLQAVMEYGSIATGLTTNVNIDTTLDINLNTSIGGSSAHFITNYNGVTGKYEPEFYTSDGTRGSRIDLSPDYGVSSLYSDGSNNQSIKIQGSSMAVEDNINSKGLEYTTDYSSNWTDHSLITKKYVDDLLGGLSLYSGTTLNATPTEIFIGGIASTRLSIATDSAIGFKGTVIAIDTTTNDSKFWKIEGLIKNIAGTTNMIGSATIITVAEDSGASLFDVTVSADDANDSLKLEVTGDASNQVEWSARIELIEVLK